MITLNHGQSVFITVWLMPRCSPVAMECEASVSNMILTAVHLMTSERAVTNNSDFLKVKYGTLKNTV